jgi:hypothetical protein
MSSARVFVLGVLGWLAAVTLLHLWLNVGIFKGGGSRTGRDGKEFRVGFLPVT